MRRIPRDLETIVLKAIEKDPKARYQTAEAMGEDLRRFLADEPIRARQVSAAERYWRWARRNPVIAVLGGVLTGVLVLVTIGSLLAAQWFRRPGRAPSGAGRDCRRPRPPQGRPGQREPPRQPTRNCDSRVRHLGPTSPMAAWDAADVGRLRSLLDLLRPAPAASPTSAAGSGAISGSSVTRIGSRSGPRRTVSPTWRSVPTGDPRRPRGERPHPALGPAHRGI